MQVSRNLQQAVMVGDFVKVSVVGTGYVGLVTAACLAEHSHHVVCVDKDAGRIEALRAGTVPIYEPGLEDLVARNAAAGRLEFGVDIAAAQASSEMVFIAVGTPPGPDGQADLSSVLEVTAAIRESMDDYCVVVIKSTVPVGTADLVAGILAGQGRFSFDVVANPEFLREGSAVADYLHPHRIVIGTNSEHAAARMVELYRTFGAPLVLTDPRSAEMIKYAANAFLAVRVSFINEIAGLCERLGADVHEVAEGIGLDPRIGREYLKAGLGYGGSCLPKDTSALVHTARGVGWRLPVLEAAMEVNRNQREQFVRRMETALSGLGGKVIGLLGLSFKPNTDDVRESPALDIVRLVVEGGGLVRAYDPKAMDNAENACGVSLPDRAEITFVPGPAQVADGADALVLATDWPEFAALPWEEMRLRMRQPFLFDGRNFLDPARMLRSGYQYAGIGRGVPDVLRRVGASAISASLLTEAVLGVQVAAAQADQPTGSGGGR